MGFFPLSKQKGVDGERGLSFPCGFGGQKFLDRGWKNGDKMNEISESGNEDKKNG